MKRDIVPWRKKKNDLAVRREEDAPFVELHRRMNDLFADFFGDWADVPRLPSRGRAETAWALTPSVDVSETDDEVRINADLPGMDEKDIEVALDEDVLTLRGEKKREHEEKNRDYRLTERSYGAFERTIPLPAGIQADKVKAVFKKGVLTVTLPKSPEFRPKERKIEVLPE